MMNKCAKFHKDSPSGKTVKFNLARAIELSETAVFVYNFVSKHYIPEPRSIRSAIRFRQREEKKDENRHARYQSRKRQEDNHKTIIPLQWPHVITVEKNQGFVFIETAGTDQLQKSK